MPYDFSNLQRYAPEGRKVWWPLPIRGAGGKEARLLVSHAGLSNKAYANALSKHNARTGTKRRAARARSAVEGLADNLAADRAIFPGTAVHDFENVPDSADNAVPYSLEACRELLAALPDWIVSDLSRFCSVASNFLEDDEPNDDEVDEQAGE